MHRSAGYIHICVPDGIAKYCAQCFVTVYMFSETFTGI